MPELNVKTYQLVSLQACLWPKWLQDHFNYPENENGAVRLVETDISTRTRYIVGENKYSHIEIRIDGNWYPARFGDLVVQNQRDELIIIRYEAFQ